MLPSKLKNYIDGPDNRFLVTGPPGSGKTFLLVSLLEYLITRKHHDPSKLLVFCFNRKWAKILRDMFSERINRSMPEIQITSVFAFCTDLLEKMKSLQPQIKVLTAPVQWRILKDTMTLKLDRNKYPMTFKYLESSPFVLNSFIQEVFDFILRAQENIIEPDMILNRLTSSANPLLQELAGIYLNYTLELEKRGLYNYGRLLTDTVNILKNDQSIRDAVRGKYDFLIIDELQEVNRAQFEIIECLRNKKCVYFGNEDECIYTFRGSMTGSFSSVYELLNHNSKSSENILRLKTNHRSNHIIDCLCREFIAPTMQRAEKDLSQKVIFAQALKENTPGCIIVKEFRNTLDESDFICHRIKQLVLINKIKPEDICIIIKGPGYKTKLLESVLEQNGLYFTQRSSRTILDNTFVRNIISFAKLTQLMDKDTGDPVSDDDRRKTINSLLTQLLSSEFSDISPSFIKNFSRGICDDFWKKINTLVNSEKNPELNKIRSFIDSVNKFRKIKEISAFDFVFNFFNEGAAGMVDHIFSKKNMDRAERESQLNIIGDFLRSVRDFVDENPGSSSMVDYLTFIDTIISSGFIEEVEESIKDFIRPGRINIMSYHQCKGLEFDAVFLPFINRNYLPAVFNKSQLYDNQFFNLLKGEKFLSQDSLLKIHRENEKKLFYTGISRARDHLAVTSCISEEKSVFFEDIYKINSRIKKLYSCKKVAPGDDHPELKRSWVARKRSAVAVYRLNTGRFVDNENFRKEIIYLKFFYPPSEWWLNNRTTVNRQNPFINVVPAYSYTSLSAYKDCPAKYKFRFYFRIKEPENLRILIGSLYHKILKKYFEHKTGHLTLELLKKLVIETVEENKFEFAFIKEEVKKKALASFQDYHERYVSGKIFDAVMEKSFRFNLGKDIINGRIDQINLLDDGRAELVDFKSGKRSSAMLPENDIQLPLYRLAVDSCSDLDFLKGREMTLQYIFLGDEKVNHLVFPVQTYDFAQFSAGIKKMISKIKKEKLEPDPESNYICSNCQFRIVCSFNNSS